MSLTTWCLKYGRTPTLMLYGRGEIAFQVVVDPSDPGYGELWHLADYAVSNSAPSSNLTLIPR